MGAINEWGVEQPRVLLISTTAYYRVKVEGGHVHAVRVALDKLTRIEVTRGTVKGLVARTRRLSGRWLSHSLCLRTSASFSASRERTKQYN